MKLIAATASQDQCRNVISSPPSFAWTLKERSLDELAGEYIRQVLWVPSEAPQLGEIVKWANRSRTTAPF